jgi:sigma-B regulation protein RsbU (phosphoserine phosphatase)
MNKASENFLQLELNALLEITQAINNNFSEEDLYKIYNFTLRANLSIKRVAFFVWDNEFWICKIHFGVEEITLHNINPAAYIKDNSTSIVNIKPEGNFDVLIPVVHKNTVLAAVFVGCDDSFNQEIKKHLFKFIQTLSNILLVAIQNKRLVLKQLEQEAIKKDLELAAQVQALLFPKQLPFTDQYRLFSTYIPHQTIGGDYYDYIPISEQEFYICIADVSGKGIPAAIIMSNFQATLRALIVNNLELESIIQKLNILTQNNTCSDFFITFFIALVNLATNQISYVNAGHNPPLLIRKNFEFISLQKGTVMLGVFDELPFIEIGNETVRDKDLLFLYTDGLVETENNFAIQFGEARLVELLFENFNNSQEILHQKIIDVLNHYKPQDSKFKDDITMFSLKIFEKK